MLRYFLGVDGGGSKCDAVLIDEQGTVHGWGRGGATTYTAPIHRDRSASRAAAQALGDRSPDHVILATTWGDSGAARRLSRQGTRVEYMHILEWEATYTAAGRQWGLAVHCGTGSWVMGRTPDGREQRRGGMGPFVGDEGSGWDLGMRGLRAALKSSWSEDHHTILAETMPAALGIENMMQVVGQPLTSGQITRGQIASAAPTVIRAAHNGDTVAREILHEAAASLSEVATVVMNDLGTVGQGYPLIGIAGVVQGSPLYWSILTDHLLEIDPTLEPEVPPFRMVVGAALEAMRRTSIEPDEQIRRRIQETQKNFPNASVPTYDDTQEAD